MDAGQRASACSAPLCQQSAKTTPKSVWLVPKERVEGVEEGPWAECVLRWIDNGDQHQQHCGDGERAGCRTEATAENTSLPPDVVGAGVLPWARTRVWAVAHQEKPWQGAECTGPANPDFFYSDVPLMSFMNSSLHFPCFVEMIWVF